MPRRSGSTSSPELKAEASTLPAQSDVKAWETATTTTPGTTKPGTPRRRTSSLLGLLIVIVVAALVMIPAYVSIGRGVNNILQGRLDGSNMVTGLYQQESIDQMVAAAGTSQFTSLNFFPDFIYGNALSQTADDRTDEVTWRYGRAWVDGASSSQSSELQRELFDVSELDMSKVAEVVHDAIARSEVRDYESVYAFVRADSETGVPEISVSISGPYESAYLDYGFNGELISASGPGVRVSTVDEASRSREFPGIVFREGRQAFAPALHPGPTCGRSSTRFARPTCRTTRRSNRSPPTSTSILPRFKRALRTPLLTRAISIGEIDQNRVAAENALASWSLRSTPD